MSVLPPLPNEIWVHIFWLMDYKDALRMRLVNSFSKEIIDSSSQLRLLIELGKEGKYPIYTSTLTSSTVKSLELLLRKRARWDQFILLRPRLIPPQDHEFHLYEFTGGILAHCVPGETVDTISFRPLKGPEEESEDLFDLCKSPRNIKSGYNVPLAFKCAELSFDWTQDLLVVVEDLNPNFPVHLYSASTGGYHPSAAKFIFDDLVDTDTTGIDVEIIIDEHTVVLAYKPAELNGDARISVLNWVSGNIMFCQETPGASSATLLSPRYLMTIRCGYTAPDSSLDIYDLAASKIDIGNTKAPLLRLSLPNLSEDRQLPNVFAFSYFIQGTHNTSHADALTGAARNGDTDVVCTQIWMSREDHPNDSARIYLFVSKRRLLKLASDAFKQPQRPQQPQQEHRSVAPSSKRKAFLQMLKNATTFRSVESPPAKPTKTHVRSISYMEWTDAGRFTRWLDGSKLQGMTRCATFGSKFACVGNPHELGLVGNKTIGGTDRGFVCILEFNERLFWSETKRHREGVVTVIEDVSSLESGLEVDVRGGLTYKIGWLKKPFALRWLDLLLDSDHVVGRLMEGFEVYRI